jgi:hypothetical protein
VRAQQLAGRWEANMRPRAEVRHSRQSRDVHAPTGYSGWSSRRLAQVCGQRLPWPVSRKPRQGPCRGSAVCRQDGTISLCIQGFQSPLTVNILPRDRFHVGVWRCFCCLVLSRTENQKSRGAYAAKQSDDDSPTCVQDIDRKGGNVPCVSADTCRRSRTYSKEIQAK